MRLRKHEAHQCHGYNAAKAWAFRPDGRRRVGGYNYTPSPNESRPSVGVIDRSRGRKTD